MGIAGGRAFWTEARKFRGYGVGVRICLGVQSIMRRLKQGDPRVATDKVISGLEGHGQGSGYYSKIRQITGGRIVSKE